MEEKEQYEALRDRQLEKIMRTVRIRTNLKLSFISLMVAMFVFIAFSFLNQSISMKMRDRAYEIARQRIEFTIPNGYISKSMDNLGILGGNGYYKISKTIGQKNIVLEERTITYGLFPKKMVVSQRSNQVVESGKWSYQTWENGYQKMRFYHPTISYKEYINDLNQVDEIPNDKLIEMAISFDKPYTIEELYRILPDVHKSWYWIDSYSEQEIANYTRQMKEADGKASFINEYETIGVRIRDNELDSVSFRDNYSLLLRELKDSQVPEFNAVYRTLLQKGYEDPLKVPIIGAIIYGTKEEYQALKENPHVKATSLGAVIDQY